MRRWLGVCAATVLACFPVRGAVEATPEAAGTLGPEVEKSYAAFLAKVTELRRVDWVQRMEKERAELKTTVALTPAQEPAAQEASTKAIEAALTDWSAKVDQIFRKTLPAQGKQAAKMLTEATSMAEAYVKENFITQFTPPLDQPAWADGLQRLLTPEQAAAWQKHVAEKKELLEQQVNELLKPIEERLRASSAAPYLNRAGEIRRTLALEKERGDKLEALARTMADKPVAEWRRMALRQLTELAPEDRQTRIKARRLGIAASEIAPPDQQAEWKERLATILTPEEIGKLSATKTERHARGVQAMGQVMIQMLDEKLAFTARQREQLRPIAERLIKDVKTLFREEAERGYYTVSTQLFFAAGAKATDAELKPILDAAQLAHWRQYCLAGKGGDGEEQAEPEEKPPVAENASLPPEPDDFENIVSDFLSSKAIAMRRVCVASALLRAEEAGRVCGLAPEIQAKLQTAARGAAEGVLRDWRRDCEQNVRSNLEGATGGSVRQRLAGMEDYYFMRLANGLPEAQPIWAETLREVTAALTPAQREALQREETARTDFRFATIVNSVLADFDNQYLLSAAQHTRMEELAAAMLKEYGPEIGNNFSNFDSTPWYLQPYYKFIPIAGIPEKSLKETLTKEQWEGWSTSREFSNCAMYWTNLEQNHARRTKK